MFSRCLLACLVLASALFPVGSAVGDAAQGPRLAVAVSRPYPQLDGIETVDANGGDARWLVAGDGKGSAHPNGDRVAWSPDGTQIAFTGSFGEYSPVIYVARAPGGRPRLVSKAGPLSDPIFSPDGDELVFSSLRVVKGHFDRVARAADDQYGVVVDWAVLAVSVRNGSIRRLTPWRRHQILTPTSFSPDGSKLAAERVTRKGEDAVAIELKSGRTTVLAHEAKEPVYAPDGSRVAFVRTRHARPSEPEGNRPPATSDLFAMPAAGGRPDRLARVKGGLAWPSWDPSGQRLSFTRLGGGSFGGTSAPHEANSVMEINADGTCLIRLLSIEEGNFYGTAWQPGPGREAGPISC
jgi:Tol biopolymer transport system component